MKHVRPIALAVITVIGVGFVAIAAAQDGPSANVEVRVWQSTSDAERLWISARPAGGNWATLGTIPLGMDEENSRGTLRYQDITLAVPIGEPTNAFGEECDEVLRLAKAAPNVDILSCRFIPPTREAMMQGGEGTFEGTLTFDGIPYGYTGDRFWGFTWVTDDCRSHSAFLSFRSWIERTFSNLEVGVRPCSTIGSLYSPSHSSETLMEWTILGGVFAINRDDGYTTTSYRYTASVDYAGRVGPVEFYRETLSRGGEDDYSTVLPSVE